MHNHLSLVPLVPKEGETRIGVAWRIFPCTRLEQLNSLLHFPTQTKTAYKGNKDIISESFILHLTTSPYLPTESKKSKIKQTLRKKKMQSSYIFNREMIRMSRM